MLILKDHGPRCTVHFTTEQAWMQTFTLGSMEGQGSAIWVPDGTHCWLKAIVQSCSKTPKGDALRIEYLCEESGKTVTQTFQDKALPMLRNTTLSEDQIEDLTGLSHLNEPSVLNALKCRYLEDNIYTYSGIVLASVNPYKDLPIYGAPQIHEYSQRPNDGSNLEPHLFAVAEEAFRSIADDDRISAVQNQSIIISGESGAGKTVNAKYIMKYFAQVCRSSRKLDGAFSRRPEDNSSGIEDRVLATNPILEAFGNARTVRNDNSSRFGKYVEILFNERSEMVGASIRTYLLEKTRVVFQAPGERGYHIFYQLCAGITEPRRTQWGLACGCKGFRYLGGVEGDTEDADQFAQTVKAMRIAGFSESLCWEVMQVLAGILHLGNIAFLPDPSNQGYAMLADPSDLCLPAQLLGIADPAELGCWLRQKVLVTSQESVVAFLTVDQAAAARDSLAKHLYAELFNAIVDRLNGALNPLGASDAALRFIGVLDIYGFERFDHRNSFEQFCINYANEKLQHIFNQQVFRLEQDLYRSEGIRWSSISWSDNQPCIDLIEGRLGILALLDEQCRFPGATDKSFLDKIDQVILSPTSGVYERDRFGRCAFTIKHFAYDVIYDADGFLEKNRDQVPPDLARLLQGSRNELVAAIFHSADAADGPPKATTGAAFKSSLAQLMQTIRSTRVHYVRCIKPNEQKRPRSFDGPFVVQQLRACGILETIRISSAGYPGRWAFEDFFTRYIPSTSLYDDHCRYRVLDESPKGMAEASGDFRQACVALLETMAGWIDPEQYQLARLENLRTQRLYQSALAIQRLFRSGLAQDRFGDCKRRIKLLQDSFRRFLAQRRLLDLRCNQAAQGLQAVWRGSRQRIFLLSNLSASDCVVSVWKTRRMCRSFEKLLQQSAAECIQKHHCMYLSKQFLVSSITAAACLQSIWRGIRQSRSFEISRQERDTNEERLQESWVAMESQLIQASRSLLEAQKRVTTLETSLATTQTALEARLGDLRLAHEERRELQDRVQKYERMLEEMSSHTAKLERELVELRTAASSSTATEEVSSCDTTLVPILPPIPRKRMPSAVGSLMASITQEDLWRHVSDPTIVSDLIGYLLDDRSPGCLVAARMLQHWIVGSFLGPPPSLGRLGEVYRTAVLERVKLSCLAAARRPSSSISSIAAGAVEEEVSADGKFAFWIGTFVQVLSLLQHLISSGEAAAVPPSVGNDHDATSRAMVLMQMRSDTARLVEDLYRGWLEELFLWMGTLGVACLMDYQGLASFQSEPGRKRSYNLEPRGSLLAAFIGTVPLLRDHRRWSTHATIEEALGKLDGIADAILAHAGSFPQELAFQLFTNIFGHLIALSFNQLLLRKHYATWKRGVQIQYNLSQLEDWAVRLRTRAPWLDLMEVPLVKEADHPIKTTTRHRRPSMEDFQMTRTASAYHHGNLSPPLPQAEPLLQAVKLLQLAKTATVGDLDIILAACPRLSLTQIRRILTLYVPDEFEDGPVDYALIRALTAAILQDRRARDDQGDATVEPVMEEEDLSTARLDPDDLFAEVKADMVPLQLSILPRPLEPFEGGSAGLPVDMPPVLWKMFVMLDWALFQV